MNLLTIRSDSCHKFEPHQTLNLVAKSTLVTTTGDTAEKEVIMAIKSTTSKPKVATSKPARKAEHPSSRQASSARKPEAKHDGFCKSVELKEERDKARKAGESNRPHTEKDTNSVEEPNGQKAAGDSPETRG
ncbi:MAG: hypothetical protein KC910_14685, partial [Candidatus Eremiobacteraeota bacterium]|nr:hypothetical protein [Candidatus Eremiobacteraeota bacterium]